MRCDNDSMTNRSGKVAQHYSTTNNVKKNNSETKKNKNVYTNKNTNTDSTSQREQ